MLEKRVEKLEQKVKNLKKDFDDLWQFYSRDVKEIRKLSDENLKLTTKNEEKAKQVLESQDRLTIALEEKRFIKREGPT